MVIYFPLNFVLWNCNLLFLETLTFRLWLKVKSLKKGYSCFSLLKGSINSGCCDHNFSEDIFLFSLSTKVWHWQIPLQSLRWKISLVLIFQSGGAPRAFALGWNSPIRYPILDEPWAVSTVTQSNTNYSIIRIYRPFKISKTAWKVKEARHKKCLLYAVWM